MTDQDELYEDEFTQKVAAGFSMNTIPEIEDLLFPEDRERTLSIWDDVDWWTGESKLYTDPAAVMPPRQYQELVQEQTQKFAENPELLKVREIRERTPTEFRWFKQDNGRIPENRLKAVPGLGLYRPDAAQALRAMKRAANKNGVVLSGGGYRSYEEQEAILYKREQGILVADPGTSEHGWGMAADFDVSDPRVFKWLQDNAKRFGWRNPEWAQDGVEPWHWEFTPSDDMEFKVPRKKTARPRMKQGPGRKVGAQDLTSTVPMSDPNGMMDAVLSLVHEDIERPEAKGKRFNLEDVPKPRNQDDIISYARQVAKKYGWTGKQWLALYELGNRESGWNPEADNPTSTAHGIPQRLMSAHPFTEGEKRKWQDPRYQIRWMVRYISDRYGSPIAALKFHDENQSY